MSQVEIVDRLLTMLMYNLRRIHKLDIYRDKLWKRISLSVTVLNFILFGLPSDATTFHNKTVSGKSKCIVMVISSGNEAGTTDSWTFVY